MTRWLYHLTTEQFLPDPYAPPSFAEEGFIHCSYRDAVADSARLYFAGRSDVRVLQIDPRLVGVAVEEVATPRGPMPHLLGTLRRAAIVASLPLDELSRAPDDL